MATPIETPVAGRKYWYDLDGYRFEYELLPSGAIQFAILSDGKRVGFAIFADYEDYFTIGVIDVDAAHRGRMLATEMCLTAEDIFDELLSEPYVLSDEGRKFWDAYNSPESLDLRRARRNGAQDASG